MDIENLVINNLVIYDSMYNPNELGFIIEIHKIIDSISKDEVDSTIYVIQPLDRSLSLHYVKKEKIKQVFKEVTNAYK